MPADTSTREMGRSKLLGQPAIVESHLADTGRIPIEPIGRDVILLSLVHLIS
jgi:hypothetical protein